MVDFGKAVEYFGLTYDTREAGYILPDGSMLDFSEKNNGGPGGYRTLDHSGISAAYDDISYGEFMDAGAIRVCGAMNFATIMTKPTPAQIKTLAMFLKKHKPLLIEMSHGFDNWGKDDNKSIRCYSFYDLIMDIEEYY
jgi:hypothetical protein